MSLPAPPCTPLPTSLVACVALGMPFSRNTLLELSMTLTRFSGTKSLCDHFVLQPLGEWVPSSPLAKARWYEATEVVQLPNYKQLEAVKQYAFVLFLAPTIGANGVLRAPCAGQRHTGPKPPNHRSQKR